MLSHFESLHSNLSKNIIVYNCINRAIKKKKKKRKNNRLIKVEFFSSFNRLIYYTYVYSIIHVIRVQKFFYVFYIYIYIYIYIHIYLV